MSAAEPAGADPARITAALLRRWPLPDPDGSGGKEDRGRVLVVGGSHQVPGGVQLAGVAALRAGAGKLQLATVQDVAVAMATAVPEARVIGLAADACGEIAAAAPQLVDATGRTDALLLGPGMGKSAASRRVLCKLLAAAKGAVVLDAGALDLAVVRAGRSKGGGRPMVLTPHLGEMAALLEVEEDAITADPAATARAFAQQWNVVLALKGSTTFIAAPDGRLWVNTGGGVGLGTSGSGDVLAGIIAGLAARGAAPEQAAVWGVWLHARAGARLAQQVGKVGFLAREIAAQVPALLAAR